MFGFLNPNLFSRHGAVKTLSIDPKKIHVNYFRAT